MMSIDQDLYLKELKLLVAIPERDYRNRYLAIQLEHFHDKASALSSYEKQILKLFHEEWDHQEHVARVLRRAGVKKRHDWSKDHFYIFVLAGKFQIRVNGEWFEDLFKKEVDRHYSLEVHHEQFTDCPGLLPECQASEVQNVLQKGNLPSIIDLREMAIDRLSRNVFRHEGQVLDEQMLKYKPKFSGANAKEMENKYFEQVENFKESAIKTYLAMKEEDSKL